MDGFGQSYCKDRRRHLLARLVGPLLVISVAMGLLTACDTSEVVLSGTLTRDVTVSGGRPAAGALTTLPNETTSSLAASVPVEVYPVGSETPVAETRTNPLGEFTVRTSVVPDGTYRVKADGKWWSGWGWDETDPEAAALVTLSSTSPTVLDGNLEQRGAITGTLADADMNPKIGVPVAAYDENGTIVATTWTSPAADYRTAGSFILGLPGDGDYTVLVDTAAGPVPLGGSSPKTFTVVNMASVQIGIFDSTTGVTPAFTDVSSIAPGGYHACVTSNGEVFCWGDNWSGQLGDGSTVSSAIPVKVSGLSGVINVDTGAYHSCAVRTDGSVWCWGQGQMLGDGTDSGSNVPVQVVGIADAVAVSAGSTSSCALAGDGSVSCWGSNSDGQVGSGIPVGDVASTPVPATGVTASSISVGENHACAVNTDTTVSCWGNNANGQLGASGFASTDTPVSVPGITNAVSISAGVNHTCALLGDATVSCWGNNDSGQLGNGAIGGVDGPSVVVGVDDAVAIGTGEVSTCALSSTGTVSCWGANWVGQLGNGTNLDSPMPVGVVGIDDAVALGVQNATGCVVRADGTAACWGGNAAAALGESTAGTSFLPVTIVHGASAIGVG